MNAQNYIFTPSTKNSGMVKAVNGGYRPVNNVYTYEHVVNICEKMREGSIFVLVADEETLNNYKSYIYNYFDARVEEGEMTRKEVKNLLNHHVYPINTSSAYWTKKRVAERIEAAKAELNAVVYDENEREAEAKAKYEEVFYAE